MTVVSCPINKAGVNITRLLEEARVVKFKLRFPILITSRSDGGIERIVIPEQANPPSTECPEGVREDIRYTNQLKLGIAINY